MKMSSGFFLKPQLWRTALSNTRRVTSFGGRTSKQQRTARVIETHHNAESSPGPVHNVISVPGVHTSQIHSSRAYCTIFSESDYEAVADETLDSLTEMFEDIQERLECNPEYDVAFSSGVLTVKISNDWGTYVINKQVPNKQIWFSSPISGPKRFDFEDGIWVYKHDDSVLHDMLNTEISEAFGQTIDFTICSHGKR